MAMKVGSIRLLFMLTREASKSNWFFIFSIVCFWLEITLKTDEKFPEQIFESTSKAVFFYSLAMKFCVLVANAEVDSVNLYPSREI